MLDAKFAAGPKFVLYFELVIFIVLGLCFTRVAPYQVFARGEKWFPSEKIVEIVVAFVTLAYFTVRELYQMAFTCVEIKILRRVRAESSRRPPRHRRDACSMAWRCRFLATRPSQVGRVIAEK